MTLNKNKLRRGEQINKIKTEIIGRVIKNLLKTK